MSATERLNRDAHTVRNELQAWVWDLSERLCARGYSPQEAGQMAATCMLWLGAGLALSSGATAEQVREVIEALVAKREVKP